MKRSQQHVIANLLIFFMVATCSTIVQCLAPGDACTAGDDCTDGGLYQNVGCVSTFNGSKCGCNEKYYADSSGVVIECKEMNELNCNTTENCTSAYSDCTGDSNNVCNRTLNLECSSTSKCEPPIYCPVFSTVASLDYCVPPKDTQVTFEQARAACKDICTSGYTCELASLNTDAIHTDVSGWFREITMAYPEESFDSHFHAWIGLLSDNGSDYHWLDRAIYNASDFNEWKSGNIPSVSGVGECKAAHLFKNFFQRKWEAQSCTYMSRYICQRQVSPPCGAVPNITNGSPDQNSNTSVGAQVIYTCDSNYQFPDLSKMLSIECQSNSTWSGPLWDACQEIPCSTPPSVQHASTDQTANTSVGAVVTYTCINGYRLPDGNVSASIRCNIGGAWSANISDCEEIPCSSPPSVQHASTDQIANTTVGALVTYTCNNGYRLPDGNMSASITCRLGGHWSANISDCKEIPCPSPPSVEHASTDQIANTTVGAVVTYTCNNGYRLPDGNMSASITCRLGGHWSANISDCKEIPCPSPPSVEHASTDQIANTTVGAVVTYTCNNGYCLPDGNMSASITCRLGGDWSANISDCEEIPCSSPPSVQHTSTDQTANTTVGAEVTYTCNNGYRLPDGNMSASITCRLGGHWNANISDCEEIPCPSPPSVEHASTDQIANTTVGAVVTYTCNNGYRLPDGNMSASITCNLGGMWSANSSDCEEIPCSSPPSVKHASTDQTANTTVGAVVTYTCNNGYRLPDGNMSASITCRLGGDWSANISDCEEIPCSTPPSVQHASTDQTANTTVGAVVTYTCNNGYRLPDGNMSTSITCRLGGDWSANVSDCEEILCPYTPSVEHASTDQTANTTVGAVVTYTCNNGYHLPDGNMSASIRCNLGGMWSANISNCEEIPCASPPMVLNAVRDQTANTSVGAIITYTCNFGYRLPDGNTTKSITCNLGGSWSEIVADCKEIPCVSPPMVHNAVIDQTANTSVGAIVTYSCNFGYRLPDGNTAKSITCNLGGSWSNNVSDCQEIPCTSPSTAQNAIRDQTANTSVGAIVTYTCNFGYRRPDGNTTKSITCNLGGNWNENVPDCQEIPCPSPSTSQNAATDQTSNTSIGAIVTYTCNFGYRLPDGASAKAISCNLGGSWSENVADCIEIPCALPPQVLHASTNQISNTAVGAVVTYSCNYGYLQPDGNEMLSITCNLGGMWSDSVDNCQAIPCSASPDVLHATRDQTSNTSLGSIVSYTCNDGYLLPDGKPSVEIQCNLGGRWSDNVTDCKAIPCGPSQDILNASKTQSGITNSVGVVVTYTCDEGYLLSDGNKSVSVTCNIGGKWSDNTSNCNAIPCPPPSVVQHSSTDQTSNTSLGDTVTYTCDNGYQLSDGNKSTSIVCALGGHWSRNISDCEAIPCNAPPTVQFATVEDIDNTSVGSVLTYKCNNGYEQTDGSTTVSITCKLGGTWDKDVSPCRAIPEVLWYEKVEAQIAMAASAGSLAVFSICCILVVVFLRRRRRAPKDDNTSTSSQLYNNSDPDLQLRQNLQRHGDYYSPHPPQKVLKVNDLHQYNYDNSRLGAYSLGDLTTTGRIAAEGIPALYSGDPRKDYLKSSDSRFYDNRIYDRSKRQNREVAEMYDNPRFYGNEKKRYTSDISLNRGYKRSQVEYINKYDDSIQQQNARRLLRGYYSTAEYQ